MRDSLEIGEIIGIIGLVVIAFAAMFVSTYSKKHSIAPFIYSQKNYEEALRRYMILLDLNPKKDSKEEKEMLTLRVAINKYELIHYPTKNIKT